MQQSGYVCSDMWKVIARKAGQAEHVLDRFHIMAHFSKALDEVRAYLLKEEFQFFWSYTSPWWAGRFLDKWCTKTMRSKMEPMKKVARMLRGHRTLLLDWFHAKGQLSSGVVEGFDTRVKLTSR
ncbi:MAG: transposase [Gammaproteobacteria bacterium]|jgi:transposase|nr:transposase [Gammaproteobacteria bacterium]